MLEHNQLLSTLCHTSDYEAPEGTLTFWSLWRYRKDTDHYSLLPSSLMLAHNQLLPTLLRTSHYETPEGTLTLITMKLQKGLWHWLLWSSSRDFDILITMKLQKGHWHWLLWSSSRDFDILITMKIQKGHWHIDYYEDPKGTLTYWLLWRSRRDIDIDNYEDPERTLTYWLLWWSRKEITASTHPAAAVQLVNSCWSIWSSRMDTDKYCFIMVIMGSRIYINKHYTDHSKDPETKPNIPKWLCKLCELLQWLHTTHSMTMDVHNMATNYPCWNGDGTLNYKCMTKVHLSIKPWFMLMEIWA